MPAIADRISLLVPSIAGGKFRGDTPFHRIASTLLNHQPTPLLHPPSPYQPSLSNDIASLRLHPALESALHILNADLPSAHFLLRKMQSLPAEEGMYLHGVLHRIEGDYDNARAWYMDVKGTGVMKYVWAGGEGPNREKVDTKARVTGAKGGDSSEKMGKNVKHGYEEPNWSELAMNFIDEVQALDNEIKGGKKAKNLVKMQKKKELLVEKSRYEIVEIMNWCILKFGIEEWMDARNAYVKSSEEIQEMKQGMTHSGKGRREF